ncbi:hypothetical protein Tco_0925176 [Tanacetum coccineum]|uniref:Uncharacterized protein n=1 Tax=Tanacetum coccineum TaxID=301880 RepID=A0ABQ5D8R1_9ASTR
MDRRPLITELRYKADSSDWIDVLSYFCQEAADEDRRIATKLNRLRKEILVICEKRRNLTDKLRSIRGIVLVGKSAEFVTDTLRKDNVRFCDWCKLCCVYTKRKAVLSLSIGYVVSIDKVVFSGISAIRRKEDDNGMVTNVSMGEDYRIALKINMVASELNSVVIEKDQFLEELDSLGVWPVPTKTA